MLSRYSVKKPLTIIVAVVMIIILGAISFTHMQTNLLPSMDMPYIGVMTTYPGASPEKVEQTVTKPLETGLSTVGGVKNVQSTSSENSSMIMFEFEYGTNMDTALVDINNKIGMIKGQMDEGVGTPMLMKLSPDMIPLAVVSVDADGKTIEELSKIVNDDVVPAFERVDGIAKVESQGLVTDSLNITLSDDKISALNDKILSSLDSNLLDAGKQIDSGVKALAEAKEKTNIELTNKKDELNKQITEMSIAKAQLQEVRQSMDTSAAETKAKVAALQSQINALDSKIKADAATGKAPSQDDAMKLAGLKMSLESISQPDGATEGQMQAAKADLDSKIKQMDDGIQQMIAGVSTITEQQEKANTQFEQQQKDLDSKKQQFETSKEQAYKGANLDSLLNKDTISKLIKAMNFCMPAGYVDSGDNITEFPVKVGDAFTSQQELSDMVLVDTKQDSVGTIKVSDVADVEMVNNHKDIYAKVNGNDGVLLTFSKQSTKSTTEASANMKKALEKIQSDYGVKINTFYDQGVYIGIVINSVIKNLLMGGVLAVLILWLFLRSLKSTLIVGISIPISLTLAVVLMYFSKVDLNILSLGGLALGVGMLVDNSIVVIENIHRMIAEGVDKKTASVKGAVQVAGAITASTLTTICVFLPIVFTQGISRELFVDMGLTIAYSLLASLVVSLTLIPALTSKLHEKRYDDVEGKVEQKKNFIDKLINAYGKSLNSSLKHKWIAATLAVVLLVVSLVGIGFMGTAFIPESDGDQLTITATTDPGTSRDETVKLSDDVVSSIKDIEGIETIGTMLTNNNTASMYIVLGKNKKSTSMEITDEINKRTSQLNGKIKASSGMSMMMGSGQSIQIQIKGADADQITSVANDIAEIVKGVDGSANVTSGTEDSSTEIRMTVDKDKAMAKGVTTAQVYAAVSTALNKGDNVTTVTFEGKQYPVVIKSDEKNKTTRDTLNDLEVATQSGEKVKVSEIATMEDAQSLNNITHDNFTKMVTVSGDLAEGANVGLVNRKIQQEVDNYSIPDGVTVELVGQNKQINDTMRDLVAMMALAIVLIYLIMVAQFQSFRSPFIVMFTIPLAATGGLLALWILHVELSIISVLGFLVLSGVVVNNGIVFVDFANQLIAAGYSKHDALVESGKKRIRPILMTALTTILGLVTLACGIGQGADMLQPMAIVIIFGLMYATLLTLYVIPSLYSMFVKTKEEKQAKKQKKLAKKALKNK